MTDTTEAVKKPRSRCCILALAVALIACIGLAIGAFLFLRATKDSAVQASCAMDLHGMGFTLKKRASEMKGDYPALSPEAGKLMFDASAIYPEYSMGPGVGLTCWADPEGLEMYERYAYEEPERLIDDHSYWYLGYVVRSDMGMEAFSAAHRARIAEGGNFESDLTAPDGTPIWRINEDFEHSGPGRALTRSTIPILIGQPGNHIRHGAHVLYMDGHYEWIEYPGKWPMTERTIGLLRELDAMGETHGGP